MAARLEVQSQSMENTLFELGLKKEDQEKECSQTIRFEMAIKITRWKMMGHYLEIPSQTLHDIEVENRTEESRRIALLEIWHKREGRRATYYRLIKALHRLQRKDLVEDMCGLIKSHSAVLTRPQEEQQQPSRPGSSVKKQLNKLETRFIKYLARLQKELIEKKVSVEALLNSLSLLPSDLKFEYDSSIQEKLPKLLDAISVEELFLRLGVLIHFIDYHLVKYFILTFGSEKLNADISLYEQDIETFMSKTTVGEVMHCWPGKRLSSEDFKELWVKIRDDPETYTLEKLNELRNKHCANLNFSVILSAIVNLAPAGSFYAVWSVRTVAVDEVRRGIQRLGRDYYAFYEPEHIDMIILDDQLVYLSHPTEKIPPAQIHGSNWSDESTPEVSAIDTLQRRSTTLHDQTFESDKSKPETSVQEVWRKSQSHTLIRKSSGLKRETLTLVSYSLFLLLMYSRLLFGMVYFLFDLKYWHMDDNIIFKYYKIFGVTMFVLFVILCLLLCKTALNVIKTGIQLKEVREQLRQFKQHQKFSFAEEPIQIMFNNIIFTGHVILIVTLTILALKYLTFIYLFFYILGIPEKTTTLRFV